MKRKLLLATLLTMVLLLAAAVALAAGEDPITSQIEVSPDKLAGLQPVDITITIANTSTDATPISVILVDPTNHEVTDFGTNGEVQLAGGESKTWQGKWDVRQIQLDNGYIYYYIKYQLPDANGTLTEQKRSIRAQISQVTSVTALEVKRTVSPSAARKDQTVTIKYDIANRGTVAIKNVTIKEHKSISGKEQVIASIEPGAQAEIKFEVKMGTSDLTSSAVVTYQTEGESKTQTQNVEAATITYGEPKLSAKLSASVKGVAQNGSVVLTLDLVNNGNVDYSDIRVTDQTLGEVFTNQQLPAGEKLSLTKEITLTETTEYQFTVSAVDNTGTSVSTSTDAVKVSVVDPSKQAHLTVTITPDRTEVYESPGLVRFSIKVENDGPVDAEKVDILYGAMKIYTFASIPMGESRTLTRDAALSQAGKYRFTASTLDAAENPLTFESNDINIAFSVPTPAPATPTPPPVPTAVPTFEPTPMPRILDAGIGAVPKAIRAVLLPVMIIGGILLLGSAVILAIATKKRKDQQRASDAAYDHLERVRRRDYRTPGEPEEAEVHVQPLGSTQSDADNYEGVSRKTAKELKKEAASGEELPHMKYVRNALERKGEYAPDDSDAQEQDLDLNTASFADIYRQSARTAQDYANEYGTSFDDGDATYAPRTSAEAPEYAPDDYATDEYATDGTNEYATDEYATDEYAQDGYAEPYQEDPYTGAYDDRYAAPEQAYDADTEDSDTYAQDGSEYEPEPADDGAGNMPRRHRRVRSGQPAEPGM